jgi:hypothetical protein
MSGEGVQRMEEENVQNVAEWTKEEEPVVEGVAVTNEESEEEYEDEEPKAAVLPPVICYMREPEKPERPRHFMLYKFVAYIIAFCLFTNVMQLVFPGDKTDGIPLPLIIDWSKFLVGTFGLFALTLDTTKGSYVQAYAFALLIVHCIVVAFSLLLALNPQGFASRYCEENYKFYELTRDVDMDRCIHNVTHYLQAGFFVALIAAFLSFYTTIRVATMIRSYTKQCKEYEEAQLEREV